MKKILSLMITTILLSTNVLIAPKKVSAETLLQGEYLVISNESIDLKSSQTTGTLSLYSNLKRTSDKSSSKSYKIDIVKPFDKNKINTASRAKKSIYEIRKEYKIGDVKSFWVSSFLYHTDEQINAELMYSGTKTNIWVNNNEITQQQAIALGEKFDKEIYSKITGAFGNEPDVDGDGKINMLYYDIEDGYTGYGSYIGGYFNPLDLFDSQNNPTSNYSDILFIDTYPAMTLHSTDYLESTSKTIAHEFQHMINFNRNFITENGGQMDTWLDEGLAESASQVFDGQVLRKRIYQYNQSYQVKNGLSLLDFGYVENYSLSYLFVQYLKKQAGIGDSVYKEIIESKYNDYRAVEEVIQKHIDSNLTFGEFMTNFRAALVLKAPVGPYGFDGDADFDIIESPLFNGTEIYLDGGGAIVKKLNSGSSITVPQDKGENITYLALWGKDIIEDLNKDGQVDIIDLSLIAQKYNSNKQSADYNVYMDFNNDDIIDIYDLVAISKKM